MFRYNEAIFRTNDSVKHYLLKNEKKESYITYRKYTVNKFLLLLMNRTWEESTNIFMYDPPHELGTLNTYVKYLIPLL